MNRGASKIFLVDKIVRTAFTEAATRLLNAFSSIEDNDLFDQMLLIIINLQFPAFRIGLHI